MDENSWIHGAEVVRIQNQHVEVCVTVEGAHVGPVIFRSGDTHMSPYSLAPWQPSEAPDADPVLRNLRGDFFCLPFGDPDGSAPHGDVANSIWSIVTRDPGLIIGTLESSHPQATFVKEVSLRDGHAAIYQHIFSPDLTGLWNFGTHPILDLSRESSARLSTSPIAFGQVNPIAFANPQRGETQILEPAGEFTHLCEVPLMGGGWMDLSRYPSEQRHEDLVQLVNDPTVGPLAWSAVTFDQFVWLALKDVRQFPSTVLWFSNGGRTESPWSGRHIGRLGVEEVCSYFALGHQASLDNPFRDSGIFTCQDFNDRYRLNVKTIQLAHPIPPTFDVVRSVDFLDGDLIRIVAESGSAVEVTVDWSYVLA